jgi:hypothetical protein
MWRGSCRGVSRALHRLGGRRHDEDPVGGMRCQHAVLAYQVQAGRWGQCGQPTRELNLDRRTIKRRIDQDHLKATRLFWETRKL